MERNLGKRQGFIGERGRGRREKGERKKEKRREERRRRSSGSG